MPAPTPARNRHVYFVGARLSCALGLPNTPALLGDIGTGLKGSGFKDAPELFRAPRFAIAHLLIERYRAVDAWDLVLERGAAHKGVPTRHAGTDQADFVVLKLHGSIDWCLRSACSATKPWSDHAALTDRLFVHRSYTSPPAPMTKPPFECERWSTGVTPGDGSRARLESPMVTMARGKAGDLGPLRDVRRHAYGAVSRAEALEIVGYPMPPDDIEMRTLLRTRPRRGTKPYLDGTITSSYVPVNSYA